MTLDTSKNLGGIGALLMFLGVLPIINTFFAMELVGLILLLVGLFGLGKHYMESGIFNNALYGVITAIVGVVIFAIVAVFALVGFFSGLGWAGFGSITSWGDMSSWAALANFDWLNTGMGLIMNFIVYILVALVVLFVFVVLTAVFLRKSLGLLSVKSSVGLFGSAGTLLLVGAVLTMIGIGFILIWISILLIAIAFFQIKSQPAQYQQPS